MAILSRDQILSFSDLTTQDFDCPEWGGTVRLKVMSGSERDAFEAAVVAQRGGDVTLNYTNYRAKLVARCAVDENGSRLFTDFDVDALGKKSSLALVRLAEGAATLNKLSNKDVEDLTKNSTGGQSDENTSS